MYNKKIKTIVIILMTLFMLLLLTIMKGTIKEITEDKAMVKEYKNKAKIELAVYYPLSSTKSGAADFFVRWWENPWEDNKCYLFLPIGIKEKNIFWKLQNDSYVWIDQKNIQDGMLFELQEGIHEVEIEKNGEIINRILEVKYSAPISAIFIETESGNMEYINETKGNTECGNYSIINDKGILVNGGYLESICGRGNASWEDTEKKSYKIKLKEKSEVLSMNEDKQWVLNPNFMDESLVRNKICYDLAEGLQMRYVPDLRYVDVYLNGDYRGNYLLMEKNEISKNRLNIRNLELETELMNENLLENMERFVEKGEDGISSKKGVNVEEQPKDLTGGYLLELDIDTRYGGEPSGFITTRSRWVVIRSPKYASYEQVQYISKLYQEFEDAIFSENGINSATGKHFSEYIDIDSFARQYLLEEVVKNYDTSKTSQYIYKPNDAESSKFYAGPPWDYDNSLGVYNVNDSGVDLSVPEHLHACVEKVESDIWYALYQKEEFRSAVIKIFKEEMCEVIEKEINVEIPKTVDMIRASDEMNLIRWYLHENITVEEKIAWHYGDIQRRLDFLDARKEFLKKEWCIE